MKWLILILEAILFIPSMICGFLAACAIDGWTFGKDTYAKYSDEWWL